MFLSLPRRYQDFILQTGEENAVLRAVAEKVTAAELKAFGALGKEMVKYVKDEANGCIGLAAPQIGISKRLIAVGLPPSRDDIDERSFPYTAMINPEIIEKSTELCSGEEGCLSLPEEKASVVRPKKITVEYIDALGKKQRLKLENFAARVVLHEIDHLDGILMTDKAEWV